MQEVVQPYRLSHQHLFNTSDTHIKIYNMDETAIYLDAPGKTTIDVIGAHTVEIATTDHEKDRVTVVICVSSDGMMLSPLVIHRSSSKKLLNAISEVLVSYVDN